MIFDKWPNWDKLKFRPSTFCVITTIMKFFSSSIRRVSAPYNMCLLCIQTFCYLLIFQWWGHVMSLWSVVSCLVLRAPLLYSAHIIRDNLNLCYMTSVPPFYATCYFCVCHVWILWALPRVCTTCLCVRLQDFLIQINPFCSYCKSLSLSLSLCPSVSVCVCVCGGEFLYWY
jgi:hypothetical protein